MAVAIATGLVDKNGTAQGSPAHNFYVGDAAGFFLLADLCTEHGNPPPSPRSMALMAIWLDVTVGDDSCMERHRPR